MTKVPPIKQHKRSVHIEVLQEKRFSKTNGNFVQRFLSTTTWGWLTLHCGDFKTTVEAKQTQIIRVEKLGSSG